MNHYDHKEKRALFIFIFVFILFAVGIAVGGYFSYRTFEDQFRPQAERQLSSIAELKATELVAWRNGRLADAEQIYQNHVFAALVRDYFQHTDNVLEGAQIQDWLKSYKINKEYDRVRLLDLEGQTHISHPVELPPISSIVAAHIPEVLQSKQTMLIDFYPRAAHQQIRLSILIPILDPADESRILGLVAISIDPDIYLYPFIEEWPIDSASAETLLIREANDALFLNDLRFNSNAAFSLRFPLTQIRARPFRLFWGKPGLWKGWIIVENKSWPISALCQSHPGSWLPRWILSKSMHHCGQDCGKPRLGWHGNSFGRRRFDGSLEAATDLLLPHSGGCGRGITQQ